MSTLPNVKTFSINLVKKIFHKLNLCEIKKRMKERKKKKEKGRKGNRERHEKRKRMIKYTSKEVNGKKGMEGGKKDHNKLFTKGIGKINVSTIS